MSTSIYYVLTWLPLVAEIQTFEEEDAQLEKETGQLSQEISHLEQQEMQLGAQLEDMEWVSWEDKVQHEEQRSAKLRQELSFYQKQVRVKGLRFKGHL